MNSTTTLSVLVPVYNEEYLVETSLGRLTCLANSAVLERVQIIVVNDGSSDRTGEALARFKEEIAEYPNEKLNWQFITHEKNKGKAAAIHTALSAATEELCVIHDADLEYHPADLLKMVQVFVSEGADAVFGSRFLASEYRRVLFFRHELGNRFLTMLCNLVSDLNLSDMETCYKMVRTNLLKSIPLTGEGF
jgi:glycosyltransferase involved in cell wall biosynthesis